MVFLHENHFVRGICDNLSAVAHIFASAWACGSTNGQRVTSDEFKFLKADDVASTVCIPSLAQALREDTRSSSFTHSGHALERVEK